MELWEEFKQQLKAVGNYYHKTARRLNRRGLALVKHSKLRARKSGFAAMRMLREVDVRKPFHAAFIGLIIAGIAAPAVSYLATESRYYLAYDQLGVMSRVDPSLGDKLSLDQPTNTIYLNKQAQSPSGDYSMMDVGTGSSKMGYSAKLPVTAGAGISVTDTQHQTTVTMTPQYSTMDGRIESDRVVYPLQNQAGVLSLTPKGNGLKEDIVLSAAPSDWASYNYKLNLEDGLQARLDPDGAVGVYSGDPTLYGNITYSSDKDRQTVETAREKSPKTYLMFEIPAPVVKQADGQSHGVTAHFDLNGNNLSVIVSGLGHASYPLSIDPSFVITSVSDFLLGKVEDNITVTQPTGDGQLNRATITAGLINSSGWQAAVSGSLPTTGGPLGTGCADTGGGNFNFGLTAYGGYLYLVGGGNTATNAVCYAALNSNGTLGAWQVGSNAYQVARIGATVVGFNGYLYVLDGEDQSTGNTQITSVEFAQVQSNGDVGKWCAPTAGAAYACPGTLANSSAFQTGTAHTYGGGVEYDGYIYMCGGATVKKNASVINTCEYTAINSDGTLYKPTSSCTLSGGSSTVWCTASSFTTARNRFKMVAYNGYIYLVGGYGGGTGGTVFSDVQYVPILSNNALGTWNTLTNTPLPSVDRNYGLAAEDGHIYVVGGCSSAPSCTTALSSTYYAVLNADGTIGAWDTTSTLGTAVFMQGVASYSGVLYSIGGCTAEPTNANGCNTEVGASNYATISPTPGDTTNALATGSTISVARAGVATVAYDGYLYAAGGCDGTSCGTFTSTVDVGTVNDNGSVTWTTTTALNANRAFGALEAYGNKLFYLGGLSATGTYQATVLDGTISGGSGAVSAWATDTNAIPTARAYLAGAQWNNYVYVLGGYNGTTYYNDVQFTKIVGGVPTSPAISGCSTTWCSTSSWGSTGEAGLGAAVYAGYMYVTGGRNGTTASTTMYQAPITNSTGALGSFTTTGTSLPTTADSYMGIVIHNNVIYALGGMTPNTGNAASNNIACAPLNSSTGVVGTWTGSCSKTLSTAEWGGGAVAYNGRLFVVGGCTSTGVPPCTAYTAAVSNFTVRNGGNGMFGTLAANTNPWAYTAGCTTSTAGCTMTGGTGSSDTQVVAYNSNIYVIGGCTAYTSGACTTLSTCVQHAPVNSDGTLGSFTSCTSSPPDAQLSSAQARYAGAAVVYVGRIYLLGGSSSTLADTSTVISAPLTATGNVDTTQGWSSNVAMPQARHGFGAAISGGFVYVAGGENGSTLQNNVMYSQISETGTLLGWTTDTHTFTTARQGLSVVAYNSNLYIGQGVDGSGNALGDVQYSLINTNGSLNTWTYTTTEDQLGKYREMAAANGYMYFFGSETSGTDVFYAAINSNGTLGNLYRASNSGALTAQPHGGTVFQNGYFYLVGGCTLSGANCNTVLPTVEEAGQKAQARIGHYAKMFNTIVNTSPTLVQANGSGQFDIIMRTEAQGATQWGVPQFISPAYATKFYFLQALDSSGTNIGIAFNYFVLLAIDDSNTGAFPDTGSVATDIDIYYHPNPGRRLRHGASFTNTGCNSIITNGCLLDTAQF